MRIWWWWWYERRCVLRRRVERVLYMHRSTFRNSPYSQTSMSQLHFFVPTAQDTRVQATEQLKAAARENLVRAFAVLHVYNKLTSAPANL